MKKSFPLLVVPLVLTIVSSVSCDDGQGQGEAPPPENPPAAAPVEKTGQTNCYSSAGIAINCLGTGQDGDIQAGVEWPVPRFTDNMDGTIRDNLTGLIWLKNANCLGGTRTWQQALDFANGLFDGCPDCGPMGNEDCGLSDGSVAGDWRLPNVRELESLFDYGTLDTPRLPSPNPFMNFQSSTYWSS